MKEISLKDEYTQMCDNQEECKMCKYYDMDGPCELLFGYDKGRADAIDECIKVVDSVGYIEDYEYINKLEQLKECNK